MRPVLALLALVIIVGAAMILPVRPYLDFQVIYHANLGLLRGIPLYDHPGQVQMISELAGVPSSQVYVLPFPYPPWYALGTLWLAAMPIALAARAWFAGNLVMLLLSGLLLAHKLSSRRSAAAVLGIVLWLPALGSLLVGQYGVPVLLGAALMIHGLREEKAPLVAVAGALLTFKPHLGGLAILLTLVSLVRRRDAFGRR
jgi:hypothetical protein